MYVVANVKHWVVCKAGTKLDIFQLLNIVKSNTVFIDVIFST